MIRVLGNVDESAPMPADAAVPNYDETVDYNQQQPSADGSTDPSGGSEIPQDLIL